MDRRRFATTLAALGGYAAASRVFGCSAFMTNAWGADAPSGAELARFPEKTDLILLTDRPPQLETPLRYFERDLTPNDAFFVRWHLSEIPTYVDTDSFRLEVNGKVKTPLSLTLS